MAPGVAFRHRVLAAKVPDLATQVYVDELTEVNADTARYGGDRID